MRSRSPPCEVDHAMASGTISSKAQTSSSSAQIKSNSLPNPQFLTLTGNIFTVGKQLNYTHIHTHKLIYLSLYILIHRILRMLAFFEKLVEVHTGVNIPTQAWRSFYSRALVPCGLSPCLARLPPRCSIEAAIKPTKSHRIKLAPGTRIRMH